MSESIFKENNKFMIQWFSLNPNFKGLEFQNNILKYNGTDIDLKTFLVSELLTNEYIRNNIYTMKANEFFKIIKLHVEAISILENNQSEEEKKDNIEYIKNVKINSIGHCVIITNDNEIELLNTNVNEVVQKYNSLLLKCNYYVPVNDLLKALNIPQKKKDPITSFDFFDLLHKEKDEANMTELNYVKYISNFIFVLNDNEHLLVDKAKYLLKYYTLEINSLKLEENLTSIQKYALKLYDSYIEILENENKKNEEANYSSSKNYGYSTFWMIFACVMSTILTLGFMLFIT